MTAIRIVVIFALLAGAVYGGSILWESDQLKLSKVEVAGIERTTADEVVEASGLKEGAHLLRISTDAVANRVAAAIAWVEDATVERILPSTVRITVEERTPHLLAVFEGRPFLIDDEGVLLEESNEPLIRVLELPTEGMEQIRPGEQIDELSFTHVIEILDGLPSEVADRVQAVRAPSVDRITLQLDGALEVLYGASEEIEAKNFALVELLGRASEEGITYIDVRVPSRPATR